MEIINNTTVKVDTSDELKEVLENDNKYKLTGMDSINIEDTINVNVSNKQIQIKNMDIEYTNNFVFFMPKRVLIIKM